MSENLGVTTSEYKVVNIKNKYYEMITYFLGMDIGVKMTSINSSVKKEAIHISIPSLRSLLEAIEGFFKTRNKVGVLLNIARRLFHANISLQIPMQEGGFDIH
jgi:hypothetical protein